MTQHLIKRTALRFLSLALAVLIAIPADCLGQSAETRPAPEPVKPAVEVLSAQPSASRWDRTRPQSLIVHLRVNRPVAGPRPTSEDLAAFKASLRSNAGFQIVNFATWKQKVNDHFETVSAPAELTPGEWQVEWPVTVNKETRHGNYTLTGSFSYQAMEADDESHATAPFKTQFQLERHFDVRNLNLLWAVPLLPVAFVIIVPYMIALSIYCGVSHKTCES